MDRVTVYTVFPRTKYHVPSPGPCLTVFDRVLGCGLRSALVLHWIWSDSHQKCTEIALDLAKNALKLHWILRLFNVKMQVFFDSMCPEATFGL